MTSVIHGNLLLSLVLLVLTSLWIPSDRAFTGRIAFGGKAGSDLELLKERFTAELLEPHFYVNSTRDLIDSMREDGSWPGIDYEDVSLTGFEHRQHLENVLELSRAYKLRESAFYRDPELRQVISAGLDFWIEHDFIAENWWWNEIGVPDRLTNILLLTEAHNLRSAWKWLANKNIQRDKIGFGVAGRVADVRQAGPVVDLCVGHALLLGQCALDPRGTRAAGHPLDGQIQLSVRLGRHGAAPPHLMIWARAGPASVPTIPP
jgi:hypothetical protein